MFELASLGIKPDAASTRAEELFQQHRRQIFRQTDQLFAKLMLFQWVACIVLALVVSPRTWYGGSNQNHIPTLFALLVGGASNLFPLLVWGARAGGGLCPRRLPPGPNVFVSLLVGLSSWGR